MVRTVTSCTVAFSSPTVTDCSVLAASPMRLGSFAACSWSLDVMSYCAS